MARSPTGKHTTILAVGTFILFLGAIISAVGAFRSVMHDPKDKGPWKASDVSSRSAYNFRHYVAVASYFPEVFNCAKLKTLAGDLNADPELYIADADVRTAASFYCWRESGDAVWLYTFGFVILFVFLILAFLAAFRASGQSAALAGIGFSSVIILWAILTIVHFQEHNNIPRVLNAFGTCSAFSTIAASRSAYAPWAAANANALYPDFGLEVVPNYNPALATAEVRAFYFTGRGGTDLFDESVTPITAATAPATPAYPTLPTVAATVLSASANTTVIPTITVATTHGARNGLNDGLYSFNFNRSPARIFGPTPRRAWLCNDDWTYDGTFRVSQNLVYGGLCTVILGALFVITAFGYLAYPIRGVIKASKSDIQGQRASALAQEFEDEISVYGEYSTESDY